MVNLFQGKTWHNVQIKKFMAKKMTQPISYNKRTPTEIMMFVDLIVEIFHEAKKATWSNNSQREIGFSVIDKRTKSNIFLGIWYESWESFGIPLCITLDFAGKAATDKYNKIKKVLENKQEKGLLFKEDYQGFALILFKHEYFNFKNDEVRLLTLFNELRSMIEINVDTYGN